MGMGRFPQCFDLNEINPFGDNFQKSIVRIHSWVCEVWGLSFNVQFQSCTKSKLNNFLQR